MRDAILAICVEALRSAHPEATPESLFADPRHAAAARALLADCWPLPVVRRLIDELSSASRR